MSTFSQIVLMVCITTIVCHTISCISSTINRFMSLAKKEEENKNEKI